MHACTVACVLRATWVEAPAGTSSVDQTDRSSRLDPGAMSTCSVDIHVSDGHMYMCGRDYGRSSTWPPAFNVGGDEGAMRGPWLNSKPGLKKELWRVTTGHLSQLASFEHQNELATPVVDGQYLAFGVRRHTSVHVATRLQPVVPPSRNLLST